jgi:hypothetical protein
MVECTLERDANPACLEAYAQLEVKYCRGKTDTNTLKSAKGSEADIGHGV